MSLIAGSVGATHLNGFEVVNPKVLTPVSVLISQYNHAWAGRSVQAFVMDVDSVIR
jgi:hypothetical protein